MCPLHQQHLAKVPNDFRIITASKYFSRCKPLTAYVTLSCSPSAPDEAVQLLGVFAGGDGHPDGGLRHARRNLLQLPGALGVWRCHLQGKQAVNRDRILNNRFDGKSTICKFMEVLIYVEMLNCSP